MLRLVQLLQQSSVSADQFKDVYPYGRELAENARLVTKARRAKIRGLRTVRYYLCDRDGLSALAAMPQERTQDDDPTEEEAGESSQTAQWGRRVPRDLVGECYGQEVDLHHPLAEGQRVLRIFAGGGGTILSHPNYAGTRVRFKLHFSIGDVIATGMHRDDSAAQSRP